jgi:hypothetical protein
LTKKNNQIPLFGGGNYTMKTKKDERIRRGFIVETNVSKCSCEHKEKHCLIPDDVCLDSFQEWTEDYDHYIDDGKNGHCRVCGDFVTFHWHYVVTHREEATK